MGTFPGSETGDVFKNNTIKFFKRTACLIFDLFLSMVYWYYLSKRAGLVLCLKEELYDRNLYKQFFFYEKKKSESEEV